MRQKVSRKCRKKGGILSKRGGRWPETPCCADCVKICLNLSKKGNCFFGCSDSFFVLVFYKELSNISWFPFHSKDINSAKDTVEKVRTRLDKLQGSQQNSLAAFGSSTVSIRKVIDQYYACGKFHKKPLGPMGMTLIMFSCIHLEGGILTEWCKNIVSYFLAYSKDFRNSVNFLHK